MPIRINLLAEQIAAEEMRRKDPIKRALIIGAALTVLMLIWIGLAQLKVNSARAEMSDLEYQISKLEDRYKAVRLNEAAMAEANRRIVSLERYSTNRIFWGTLLDAVQNVAVSRIRLTEIRGDYKYVVTEPGLIFSTNVPVAYVPQPAGWKFWASPVPSPSLESLILKEFKTLTNARQFRTNFYAFTNKITPTLTNEIDKTITAKVDFTTLPSAIEQISLELRGRDYATPYGSAVDEFANRINASEYFKQKLKGRGSAFAVERPPQPQRDLSESSDSSLFVPFTIQIKFGERILTNE
jgi:hypothetical protein